MAKDDGCIAAGYILDVLEYLTTENYSPGPNHHP